ncbi:regulatory protein RecX [Flavobacterium sp.]|uniref:regulatory protein RecX n=1 Tax=Flavobacterium sp. TaxID=239 RepID=UPI00374C915C
MQQHITVSKEIIRKLEFYCAYQERCHNEVTEKMRSYAMTSQEIDTVMAHLITDNFLNEERFACSFARGKHRIKSWGKIRIVNELKFRQISKYNIDKALKEFSEDEYLETFHKLAENHWEIMRESNILKKRKKFCDFMLRKGFESGLVYEKVKELEAMTSI